MTTQTSNRPPAEVISRVDGIASTLRHLAGQLDNLSDAIPTRPDPTRVDELLDVLDDLRCRIARLRNNRACSAPVVGELCEVLEDLDHAVTLADGLPR